MLATRTYLNREHAGRQLARALKHLGGREPVIVALTPQGVSVARQVADRLGAELEALAVAGIHDAEDPSVRFGAASEGGVSIIDRQMCSTHRLTPADIERAVHRGVTEARRQSSIIHDGQSLIDLTGRHVIVVDDGVTSGMRMSAAVSHLRHVGAQTITIAVPVAPRSAIENLQVVADEVICPSVITENCAVDDCYEELTSLSESEIASILRSASHHEVVMDITDPHGLGWQLHGSLGIPRGATAMVVFAHGSGSSRHSPRNREVASSLNEAGFATLLFDLLTEEEESHRDLVFDIDFLARRLTAVVDWCADDERVADMPLGLFGASTGAAAALTTAAYRPHVVRAVVSRGGRPDLAGPALERVEAPTLLIVGGEDYQVIDLNETALKSLGRSSRMEIIPGATHLFEEPGALDKVCLLARSWFDEYLIAAELESNRLIRYRRTS